MAKQWGTPFFHPVPARCHGWVCLQVGDLYVVRGVEAGVERVSTRLSEAGQEALSDTVLLTVAEAFSLEPRSPVFLLPGTPLRFRLRTLRANVFHGGAGGRMHAWQNPEW